MLLFHYKRSSFLNTRASIKTSLRNGLGQLFGNIFIIYISGSLAPTNVSFTMQDTITVKIFWNPPTDFVGNITSYQIECIQNNSLKISVTFNAT